MQTYQLTVGTSRGGADLSNSGNLAGTQTSYSVPRPLPAWSRCTAHRLR